MKTATLLSILLVLVGCSVSEVREPSPLQTSVLPVACDEESVAFNQDACGQYFYDLGVAQGHYNVATTGWTGNYDAAGAGHNLDQFRAGLKSAGRTTPPTTSGYSTYGTTGANAPVSTSPNSMLNIPQQPEGIPRYGDDQATGPVINGVHHGIPAGPPQKTCHGAILNGQCTGPEF